MLNNTLFNPKYLSNIQVVTDYLDTIIYFVIIWHINISKY